MNKTKYIFIFKTKNIALNFLMKIKDIKVWSSGEGNKNSNICIVKYFKKNFTLTDII